MKTIASQEFSCTCFFFFNPLFLFFTGWSQSAHSLLFARFYPDAHMFFKTIVSGAIDPAPNLVPRVVRLLGQRCGRQATKPLTKEPEDSGYEIALRL